MNNTKKLLSYSHALLSTLFALFFIYWGIQKFIPPANPKAPVDNSVFIEAFEDNIFVAPTTFKITMKMYKTSGFLKMIGVFQVLSGLLILLPMSRLLGLLLLMPITINIFSIRFFMDNDPSEHIETSILLLINLLLVSYFYPKLKGLIGTK